MMRRSGSASEECDNRSDDDSHQNRSREPANRKDREQHEAEHRHQRRVRGQMPSLHWSAGHTEGDQSGLIQPDEAEEQSDPDGEAVAQTSGYAFHNPLAQPQNGHQDEQYASNKN